MARVPKIVFRSLRAAIHRTDSDARTMSPIFGILFACRKVFHEDTGLAAGRPVRLARQHVCEGASHARKENPGTCQERQARGQVALHAGGRIRPRDDRSHSPGQARRTLDEAGDCHRTLQVRRAGVKLPPPEKGKTSEKTRRNAECAYAAGQNGHHQKVSQTRAKATTKALKREPTKAASSEALSRQAKQQAKKRTAKERSEIGRKAAHTRLAHQSPQKRARDCPQGGSNANARQDA